MLADAPALPLEEPVPRIMVERMKPLADRSVTTAGLCDRRAGRERPRIMVTAHMDELAASSAA